jgi:hypothetical protein
MYANDSFPFSSHLLLTGGTAALLQSHLALYLLVGDSVCNGTT